MVTGSAHYSIVLYIMLQIYSVEHSYGLSVKSLREAFTICTYTLLTARSLSILVTPQCKPTKCNRNRGFTLIETCSVFTDIHKMSQFLYRQ